MSTVGLLEQSAPRTPSGLRQVLRDLAPHRRVSSLRSSLEATGTLLAFVALWIATYLLGPRVLPLAFLTGFAAALCLSRIFVLFHDCVHYALFRSVRANRLWGTLFGLLVYTPYERWRRSHLDHHRAVGDIDRSEEGYLQLHTVREYQSWSSGRRRAYRIFRWPPILIGLVPFVHFALGHRLPAAWRSVKSESTLDVHITSIVLVALHVAGFLLLGFWHFAVVQASVCAVGASIAGWLFFVQHHFKDVVWRTRATGWTYYEGALRGSSYLRVSPLLDWIWLGIVYHHVHHLDARIPCYRLAEATSAVGSRLDVPSYTLLESLPFARLALWDEEQQRLVPFPPDTTSA